MPSFNGVDLGPFAHIKTRTNRVDLQLTSYPGINGLAALAMGSRGYVTTAEVGVTADIPYSLGAIAAAWYAMVASATLGTLIDSYGYSWPNVVVVDFYPTSDIMVVAGFGVGQEFAIEFLHLN